MEADVSHMERPDYARLPRPQGPRPQATQKDPRVPDMPPPREAVQAAPKPRRREKQGPPKPKAKKRLRSECGYSSAPGGLEDAGGKERRRAAMHTKPPPPPTPRVNRFAVGSADVLDSDEEPTLDERFAAAFPSQPVVLRPVTPPVAAWRHVGTSARRALRESVLLVPF